MSASYLPCTTVDLGSLKTCVPGSHWPKRPNLTLILFFIAALLSTKLSAKEETPSQLTQELLTKSLTSCEKAVDGLTRFLVSQGYSAIPVIKENGLYVVSFIQSPRHLRAEFRLVFLTVDGTWVPDPEYRQDSAGKCLLPDRTQATWFLYITGRPEPNNKKG